MYPFEIVGSLQNNKRMKSLEEWSVHDRIRAKLKQVPMAFRRE